ncbi:hypothetical protein GYRE_02546 [Yokenella regensburgei ATCC 49455]|nr:hypothetical protein GYRE_02546 [Yokenella regensburgei ATCC 49455]SUQ03857.1 Uncharacterised protein [Yokenella regensburgei]
MTCDFFVNCAAGKKNDATDAKVLLLLNRECQVADQHNGISLFEPNLTIASPVPTVKKRR